MKTTEKADIAETSDLIDVRSRIFTIRGVQVMLDKDLAVLYGVPTKALNQAVKRNVERFPEGFMFQLTRQELSSLRSQSVTSNVMATFEVSDLRHESEPLKRGGLRYCPYAFTEHGVIMLASLLKSKTAKEMSVRIVNAFVSMRRFILTNEQIFQRLECVENRQLATDGKVNEILDRLNSDQLPLQCIFYQGQFWDAKSLLIKFIRRAKKELILIDAYLGVATLDMLAKRVRGVSIEVVTHSNGELAESDFEAFARQYGRLKKTICGICHDRFIIVDQKEIYWTGASLKDAGRLTFAAAKMGAEIIPGLLESIRKATRG